ncbi:MAG: sigma-70 family RNA polymerase sigma factor [Acidobacteria bacterium]|uniref:Sigma-70 family RNA polymerase sigma factor n=1 Tax=Candidatus Polarisedimenticola svalbardensis TaxID=2886004 RepID=A0A8J6XZD0_9BACT|nr:sigma-70 family RNA polymerase sigma factor [Candidatus Polarisedimenticola svalbardensis]
MKENPEVLPDAVRDQAAVEAARSGDHEAFGELVRRYQGLVAGVAWRYGTRREEIEDIVSEVFIKMYGSLDRFRPTHRFSSWLYRLAANHVIDHHRRNRKERGRVEMPEQVASPDRPASETMETDQRSRLLRAALSELPNKYREPLLLVYLEAMKVDEAARVLGVPTGTVKTRLMRGRRALGKILAGRNPELFGGADAL